MFLYDEEIVRKPKAWKKKRKVIQTQTSPVHHHRSTPASSVIITEERHHHQAPPPDVYVTEATPREELVQSPKGSLPGSVDENIVEWGTAYPEPIASTSGPRESRRVEKVTVVRETRRAVTPSSVDMVGASQLKDSTVTTTTTTMTTSPRKKNAVHPTKGDLFQMLPDITDGSANTGPG